MNTACCDQNTYFSEKRVDWNRRWIVMHFAVALILLAAAIQVYIFWGSFVGLNNFTSINEVTFEIDKTFQSPKGDTVKIVITNNMSRPITLVGAKIDVYYLNRTRIIRFLTKFI
jgi:hypothetical protein